MTDPGTQPDLHPGEKTMMLRLGIVAAAAALVGSLIGGSATVGAVWWQTSKAEEESVEQFRRDKLGDKYSDLLADLEQMADRLNDWEWCAGFDREDIANGTNADQIARCKADASNGRELGNHALNLKDEISFASPAAVNFAWNAIATYNGAYTSLVEIIPILGSVPSDLNRELEQSSTKFAQQEFRSRFELIRELGLPSS